MPWTLETLPPFLLAHGLVAPRDVVLGEVTLDDVSRRNRTFRLRSPAGDWLVKQASGHQGSEPATVRRESDVLRVVAERPELTRLRAVVPPWRMLDAATGTLVAGLVAPSTTLTKAWINGGAPEFPPALGALAGRTLALVHSGGGTRAGRDALLSVLPAAIPYNFRVDINHGVGVAPNPAQREILRRVGADGRLAALAERCARSWRTEEPIHNDVRFDNVVVTTGARPLRVVDWELAIRGEGAWDVACFLADFARLWATQVRSRAGRRDVPDDVVWASDPDVLMPFPSTAAAPAVEGFRSGYARARRFGPARAERAWSRALEMLPIALARVALEMASGQETPGPGARAAALLVVDALDDPAAAVARHLGVSP